MDEYSSFINNLGKYEKSLQEEYEVATNSEDPLTVRKLIDQKIAAALPGFVDDLILIARTGDTDSSRLKAIQFAFNWYFSSDQGHSDPFTKLLNELTDNDNKDANPQLRPSNEGPK